MEDVELKKCEHSSPIYRYLRSLEVEERRRPLYDYMEIIQTDITAGMRVTVVDWLVKVADRFELRSDTLYLTISYIDRYLSSHVLSRNKFYLLGISCMLIASKHEEVSPPHLEAFCLVVEMEKEILKFLNFEVSNPTTKTFLRTLITKAVQENFTPSPLKFKYMACYLAELSLLYYRFLRFNPSMVAASTIFLSIFTFQPEKHPWSLALQLYSGYEASELKDCVLALHDLQLFKRGNPLQEVRKKYMNHKFKHVAVFPSPAAIPPSYFEAINQT